MPPLPSLFLLVCFPPSEMANASCRPADATKSSGREAEKVADFLVGRLNKSNLNVKLKALQIISVRLRFPPSPRMAAHDYATGAIRVDDRGEMRKEERRVYLRGRTRPCRLPGLTRSCFDSLSTASARADRRSRPLSAKMSRRSPHICVRAAVCVALMMVRGRPTDEMQLCRSR